MYRLAQDHSAPTQFVISKITKVPQSFDRPHQMNVSAVYEPPIFRTGPIIARLLLGGWQVAPIWTAYSALT